MSNADRTEADRIDGERDEKVGHGQNRVRRRKKEDAEKSKGVLD